MSANAAREPNRIADHLFSILKQNNVITDLGWVLSPGTSFNCFSDSPSHVALPDVAFTSFERMPIAYYSADGHCPIVPDLVVEVVEPDDRVGMHTDKLMKWLSSGVRFIWELYPKTRSVYVIQSNGRGVRLGPGGILSAAQILPGFSLPIAELFRVPGESAPVA